MSWIRLAVAAPVRGRSAVSIDVGNLLSELPLKDNEEVLHKRVETCLDWRF